MADGTKDTAGKTRYRLDIEGLRAVAILGIVLYHINPWRPRGGFVGVDVFFVISGYLITDHIVRDLVAGRFSLRDFYLRRVRRLYPALFVMAAAAAAAVLVFYLPADTAKYGASLISTIFYLSNFYFYTQDNYFNKTAQESPLLHTWSLSVEEQFYLFFPILMMVLYRRWPGGIKYALVLLIAASLVLSQFLLSSNMSASFFMSPTRFWQLLAGGLVVFIAGPEKLPRVACECLAAAGLAMIAAALAFLNSDMPYPGLYAILPTLGTALVIYSGRRAGLAATKPLAFAPARFFGRISYSLYLWHWPILAIYRYRFTGTLDRKEQVVLFLASVAAGTLSYYLIERPTRGLAVAAHRRMIVRAAAAASLAGLALGFYLLGGAPGRFSPAVQKIASYETYGAVPANRIGTCFLTSGDAGADAFHYDECLAPVAGRRNILLMGDSHAAHFYTALKEAYPDAHIAQATASGCNPVLDGPGAARCTVLRDRVFNEYLPRYHYDVVILSAEWSDDSVGRMAKTVDLASRYAGTVVVAGPSIEYDAPLPKLIAFSTMRNDGGRTIDAQRRLAGGKALDARLHAAVTGTKARYFSLMNTLCPQDKCQVVTADNMPIIWDGSHFTAAGANEIVADMKKENLF